MKPEIRPPFRSRHVVETDIAADADAVFVLMCPVREYEWVEGWRTCMIWSESGLVEEGCIFTTAVDADPPANQAVWITTLHDPRQRRVEMVRFVPGRTVTRLSISVSAAVPGSRLSVAYELTALAAHGRPDVAAHTRQELEARIVGAWKPAIERRLGGAA